MKKQRDHIEKPEDKIWRQWFDKLSPKEHKQYWAKLGLTEEDEEDLPEIEKQLQEAANAVQSNEDSLRKKKR